VSDLCNWIPLSAAKMAGEDPNTLEEEELAAKIFENFTRETSTPVSAALSTSWFWTRAPPPSLETADTASQPRDAALQAPPKSPQTPCLLVTVEIERQQREPRIGHQYRYTHWEQFLIRANQPPSIPVSGSKRNAATPLLQIERITPPAVAAQETQHVLKFDSDEVAYRLLFFRDKDKDTSANTSKSSPRAARIEVWQRQQLANGNPSAPHLVRCIPTDRVHGDVYSDALFGGCAYSATQMAFFYVAEQLQPTHPNPALSDQPHINSLTTKTSPEQNTPWPSYSAFRHIDDYGEQFVGKRAPRLYTLEALLHAAADQPATWRVRALRITGAARAIADADAADPQCRGDVLVWIARQRRTDVPRGHVYCTNRPSVIVIALLERRPIEESESDADGSALVAHVQVVIGADADAPWYYSRTCPRLHSDALLVWAEAPCDAPHCTAHWITEAPLLLIDEPKRTLRLGPCRRFLAPNGETWPRFGEWPGGFYPLNPARVLLEGADGCFGSEWIVLNAVVGSRARPVLLDRRTGALAFIGESEQACYQRMDQVLAVKRSWLPEPPTDGEAQPQPQPQPQPHPQRLALDIVVGTSMTLLTAPTIELAARLIKEDAADSGTARTVQCVSEWCFAPSDQCHRMQWCNTEASLGTVTLGYGAANQTYRIGIASLALSAGGWLSSVSTNPPDRFEAIVVAPNRGALLDAHGRVPLVLVLHGGPHACYLANVWNPGVAVLARLGCVLVLPNYRGSLGQGEARLRSLLGKIGEQDVQECVLSMECALENADFWRWFRGEHQPLGDGGRSDNENDGSGTSSGRWYPQWSAIDRRRVGVVGGSHGGFLGAHLSAVRPSVVRAVVLRNPVVDIATMVSQTDIADWCYHECGIEIGLERGVERSTSDSNDGIGDASASSTPGNIHRVPQLAELERMRLCSPISHADRVRAATLLQIGGQDQRVPCSQGFQWARAIRTQAEALRVLFYPRSNHAIEDSPSFDDAWIQCLAWLLKFLPASNADDADDHVRGSASRPA